jgi:DNA/RNA endonuclease YhcR with UshA esterase domain
MRGPLGWRIGLAWFAGALLASPLVVSTMASAQQKTQSVPQRSLSYDISREVSVQGTVLSYTERSSEVPFGPRVNVQTNSGALDVHLGNARLLESNHFTLSAGDTVRIVGENVPFGSSMQFLARVIQKGEQVVQLRTAQGFPLRPMGKSTDARGAL